MIDLEYGGVTVSALPSGALWWGDERLLCVSDLHLGKSERMARRAGVLLPPYETAATLARLDADIRALGPKIVVCLGDSFDDLTAAGQLDSSARLTLAVAQAGRDWIWIEGNHDAGPVDLGGRHLAELRLAGVVFRHIALAGTPDDIIEISGHYHPKARLAGQNLPAFWWGGGRMILPAYGAYTGGLTPLQAPLQGMFGADALALALLRGRIHALPLLRG